MRFVLRWLFRLALVVVVLVVALVLLRGAIAKAIIEQQFQTLTGLEAHIGRVQVGLWSPSLSLENVTIMDTAEFAGVRLADIAELHAVYDGAALRSRQLRFKLLRLQLRELHVVESLQGTLNTGRFAATKLENQNGAGGSQAGSGWRWVEAEVFNLSIDKLQYTRMQHPEESQRIALGVENEVIMNVRSFDQITSALMNRALKQGVTLTFPLVK